MTRFNLYIALLFCLFITIYLQVPTDNYATGISIFQKARILILVLVGSLLLLNIAEKGGAPIITPFGTIFAFYYIYVLIGITSTFYSAEPKLTLFKSFELLIDFLVISQLYWLTNSYQKLIRLWNVAIFLVATLPLFYFIVTLVTGEPFVQIISGLPIWAGYGARNTLSALAAIFIMISFSRIINNKNNGSRYYLIFATSLVLLLISASRTSIVLLFAFMIPYLLIISNKKSLFVRYGFVLTIAGLTVIPAVTWYLLRGQSTEVLIELSGRYYLWGLALEVFLESPFFGHGYYSGSKMIIEIGNLYTDRFSNVDNMFLEVSMWLGLAGVIPLSIFLFKVCFDIMRRYKKIASLENTLYRNIFIESSSIIIFTTLRSFLNPTIQSHHWNTLLLLIAVVALYKAHYFSTIARTPIHSA